MSDWLIVHLGFGNGTYDQIHELIKSLNSPSETASPNVGRTTYTDGANDADRQLLVQPDLDRRALLQQAEEKVDWGQQNTATAASTSSSHCVRLMMLGGRKGLECWVRALLNAGRDWRVVESEIWRSFHCSAVAKRCPRVTLATWSVHLPLLFHGIHFLP